MGNPEEDLKEAGENLAKLDPRIQAGMKVHLTKNHLTNKLMVS